MTINKPSTRGIDNKVHPAWTMSLGLLSRWCWPFHSMLEMVKMYMDNVFWQERTCALYMSGKVSPQDILLLELSLTINLLWAWHKLTHGDNEYASIMASKGSQPKHPWWEWVSHHRGNKGISIKTYIKIHDEYISHEIDTNILHHTSRRNQNNIAHITENYQRITCKQ